MKLLKIHKAYMLNFVNGIIFIIIGAVSLVLFLINIRTDTNYNNYFYVDLLSLSYKEMLILYFKLVMIMLFCYVIASAYTKKSDSYRLLIRDFPHIKIKYILTKLVISFILPLVMIVILFLIYSFVGILNTNWFYVTKEIVYLFLICYLMLIIYGLQAIVFVLLIPSTYACFIPGILFVFGELLRDKLAGSFFLNGYELLFPALSIEGISYTSYGLIHLLILLIIYLNVVILLYLKKK